MRQLFLEQENNAVKEICQPYLDCDQVLISVKYSFLVSGIEVVNSSKDTTPIFFTEVPNKIRRVIKSVSQIQKEKELIKSKLISQIENLGYSCSGEVIAVGKDVKKIKEGDFVACAGANFEKNADMLSVPQHQVSVIKDKNCLKSASLTKIGAIALQGIRSAKLQIGENVCILGLGVLGQLTVQLSNLSGCNVIGVDIIQEKILLAKELGAFAVYNSSEDNILSEVEILTDYHGVDCTIITASSKSDSIIEQAIKITRKRGKIIIISDISLNINKDEFYKKEIELIICPSYSIGRTCTEDNCSCKCNFCMFNKDYPHEIIRWTEKRNMQEFIKLVESKKINTDKLISEATDITSIERAYNLLKNKSTLGVLVTYPEKNQDEKFSSLNYIKKSKEVIKEVSYRPARRDSLSVGILGAGEFSKQNIIPIVSQQSNININSLADRNLTNLLSTSKICGARQCFNSYQEFFDKDLSDVVIISSEHKYHCIQAINAMENGKAVFLEKPMATNFQELDKIKKFLEKNKEIPFCVNYSRSFSPFVQKIKSEISNRRSPLVINYRMNVELLKKNNLAQEDMGAGRIIGEACSIFDMFFFLTDSKPLSVSVESIGTTSSQLFPTDNFCVQISFQDGSLCSLTYTSLGNQEIGRERMELFFDAKSIIMQDYKTLKGYGTKKSFDETLDNPNKGRSILIGNFFDNLKQSNFVSPISVERLCNVAELTLVVDKLACQNGGSQIIG